MVLTLKTLLSFAVLWHIFAFAAGGVYVFHAYRVLFLGGYNPSSVKVIRSADWQLWLSGFMIIGLGIALYGFDRYTANPKLWAKVIVITIWLISTQTIRQYAVAQMRTGYRTPMLLASAVNIACWVYGAFLGVAKPLGFGAVSFTMLMAGFDITIALCLIVTIALENRRLRMATAFNTPDHDNK